MSLTLRLPAVFNLQPDGTASGVARKCLETSQKMLKTAGFPRPHPAPGIPGLPEPRDGPSDPSLWKKPFACLVPRPAKRLRVRVMGVAGLSPLFLPRASRARSGQPRTPSWEPAAPGSPGSDLPLCQDSEISPRSDLARCLVGNSRLWEVLVPGTLRERTPGQNGWITVVVPALHSQGLASISALPRICCVTLEKSLTLSEARFPPLKMGMRTVAAERLEWGRGTAVCGHFLIAQPHLSSPCFGHMMPTTAPCNLSPMINPI